MQYISTMQDTKQLAITIYNNNFGVVKDCRSCQIGPEIATVQFLDVAQRIETDSIIVDGVRIQELNYDYDLVSKEKLLEKYLDKIVTLVDEQDQSTAEYRLLSTMGGLVLEKVDSKEILLNPKGQLVLPRLADHLLVNPALVWKIHPSKADEIRASYITKGMKWRVDYVLNIQDTTLDLSGWVNITNRSGVTYENAHVKIIAGEINRMSDNECRPIAEREYMMLESRCDFVEQNFADYHMYTLANSTTLKNNQSKQINFLSLSKIPYKRYYEYSRYGSDIKTMLEVSNSIGVGLGIPLPKGIVKVYQEDKVDGNLEFIGEDAIDHTPKDKLIKLHLGKAFDIKGECRNVESKKYASGRGLEKYQYTFSNHKDEAVCVKFSHDIGHRYWKMVECNSEYTKVKATEIAFLIDVPANSEKVVLFEYLTDERVSIEVNK